MMPIRRKNRLDKSNEAPSDDLQELRIRVLHDLIASAQQYHPEFAVAYVSFMRNLREQLHPVGIRDIRLVDSSSGLKWSVDVGDRLGADFYYGYWGEFLESELFLSVLKPGDVVIDIGANFGYYTVSAAVKIGAHGVVHAFEADPFAFQLLRSNVSANGLVNAQCHNVCIAATDGDTRFHVMTESAFSGISA